MCIAPRVDAGRGSPGEQDFPDRTFIRTFLLTTVAELAPVVNSPAGDRTVV